MAKRQIRQILLDGITIPSEIGHGYRPLKIHSIDYIKSEKSASHRRLHVFHHKGCKCANPECSNEGHYVIVGKDRSGGVHVDLYTKNFVLMTVDHIYPKSKGGEDILENKQPMCSPCNSSKDSKVIVYDLETKAPILQIF